MREQQKKIQRDGSTGEDSETTKTGITFSIDGITYHVSEDDMIQIDPYGGKGIMLYDFFETDTYRNNPLPDTRDCSGCGAIMEFTLPNVIAGSDKPSYQGPRGCYAALEVTGDYIIKDGDHLVFSISYCDD